MKSQNIDQAEVKKFSEAAANWWDLHGEFKTLHELNPLRLQYINEKAPLSGKKVIDIGCGGGILTESMAKLGAEVTGVDLARPHSMLLNCPELKTACQSNISMAPLRKSPNSALVNTTWSLALKCLNMYPTLFPLCNLSQPW